MIIVRKKITVIYKYPEDINIFQDIMCNALAKDLLQTKSPAYIEALKLELRRQIYEESL